LSSPRFDYIKNALKNTVLSAAFAEFADLSHCVLLLFYIANDYFALNHASDYLLIHKVNESSIINR